MVSGRVVWCSIGLGLMGIENMKTARLQRGRSLLAILAILVVVGFFALLGVRLAPVYLDYWTIVSVAESVQEDPEYDGGSLREVRRALKTRMTLNNLRSYDDDIYSLSRADDGGYNIDIVYEKRVPFIANVELVAAFERRIEP